MPQRLATSDPGFEADFAAFLATKREVSSDVDAAVAAIIDDVRARGDAAVIELSRRFDGVDLAAVGMRVTDAEIEAACASADRGTLDALQLAHDRIASHHARQLPTDDAYTDALGVELATAFPLPLLAVPPPTGLASVAVNVPALVGDPLYQSRSLLDATEERLCSFILPQFRTENRFHPVSGAGQACPGIALAGAALGGDEAFALGALAGQLAGATNGFGLFAGALLGGLFVEIAQLHLAKDSFALKLLLERAERLVNVVVAYEYLHVSFLVRASKGLFRFLSVSRVPSPGTKGNGRISRARRRITLACSRIAAGRDMN